MELKYGIIGFVVTILFYFVLFACINKANKNEENAEELEKLFAQISYIPVSMMSVSVYVLINLWGNLNALESILLFNLIIWITDRLYYRWSKNTIDLECKIAFFYTAMLLWIVYLLAERILGTDPLKYRELLFNTLGVLVGLVIPVNIIWSGDNIKEKRRQILKGMCLNQLFASKVWRAAIVFMGVFLVVTVIIGRLQEGYISAISIGFILASITVALGTEFKRRKEH